jgi:hypothetical protein
LISKKSEDGLSLRKKLFKNALEEFKDEEYQEIKTKEIEGFLNEDYKRRKQDQENYIIRLKYM